MRVQNRMPDIKHVSSLVVTCYVLWLFLSGHYQPLLLSLGAVSTVLTVIIALRMEVIDHESHPLELTHKLVAFWGWLIMEIVKANLDVARRILQPSMPISPSVIRVPIGARTDMGRTIFANSITLTPGTVSLDVREHEIEVHALTEESARGLLAGTMARRIPDPGGKPS